MTDKIAVDDNVVRFLDRDTHVPGTIGNIYPGIDDPQSADSNKPFTSNVDQPFEWGDGNAGSVNSDNLSGIGHIDDVISLITGVFRR